jgi:hypothetical protein
MKKLVHLNAELFANYMPRAYCNGKSLSEDEATRNPRRATCLACLYSLASEYERYFRRVLDAVLGGPHASKPRRKARKGA